jgi:hypothetical protein
MNKTSIGILLSAVGFALALSPGARAASRKLAIKAAGVLLEVQEQIKDRSSGHDLHEDHEKPVADGKFAQHRV